MSSNSQSDSIASDHHWKKSVVKKRESLDPTPGADFKIPGWVEPLTMLWRENLHHEWIRYFHRQLFSTRSETMGPISDDDVVYLLSNDPLRRGVISAYVETSFCSGSSGSMEAVIPVRAEWLHLMRPDGLQFVFDIRRDGMSSTIRNFLVDNQLTIVLYDAGLTEEALAPFLRAPIPSVLDIQPLLKLIKETKLDVFGKPINDADVDEVARDIVGREGLGQGIGSYLTSGKAITAIIFDVCVLIERKRELLTPVTSIFEEGRAVKTPNNLTLGASHNLACPSATVARYIERVENIGFQPVPRLSELNLKQPMFGQFSGFQPFARMPVAPQPKIGRGRGLLGNKPRGVGRGYPNL